ncbi:hypothetical protein CBS101457_003286 [Exobasidium rhododendri]|nr:hypothetical protein CBS101457_003286 [Exobasidium rhododendri]
MDTVVPGALAAFVVDCSIFPLDTIKSRIQAVDYQERFPQGRGLYAGLWQGFGPVVLATLPSAALFFTTYEHAKSILTSPTTPYIGEYVASDPRALALAHTTSSAIAELASCLILTPAETIKQQMQVATAAKKREVSSAPLSVRSVWRGYWALAGRNLPFTAIQFPLYEYFRTGLAKRVGLRERKSGSVSRAGHQGVPEHRKDVMVGDEARKQAYETIHRPSTSSSKHGTQPYQHYLQAGLVSGASAACAGAISALITTPLDLLKTRVMLQTAPEKGSPPSMRAIMVDIWKREGFVGLMRGGTLRCAWTALGAGIYLGAYESGREWWNDAGKEQAKEVVDRAGELVEEVKRA